ncbi:hypothetical protein [Mucilaginibacter lacusdianchii]|uniref:hypothetical protein n=1 Tax=Mucilaginibacter lacusdianchii TaxID=2684211 RepID=UPI00131E8903|nr:hypothetical protein [Mucilaginibacter sp. JXJ CY 39]
MAINQQNLEYLQKLQGNLGFGDKLNGVLETAISRELPQFTLGINNVHRPLDNKDINALKTDVVQFQLHYNRQKNGDTYFLNAMDVTLHKTGESVPRKQTFDLDRDHRITALQAYKLLSGLSLEKDIYVRPKGSEPDAAKSEKLKAWFKLQLDVTDAFGNHPLKVLRPEYGFQLENTLDKYPIKALAKEDSRTEGLQALRSGNYWSTEIKLGNKSIPVNIAANPVMKSMDIFDKNGREIRDEDIWPEKAVERSAVKTTTVYHQEAPEQDHNFVQDRSADNVVSRGR